MILRVYRARAAAGARGLVLAHLRDHVYPTKVRTTGLHSFQAGIRDLPDGALELVLVSTWKDFEALLAGIGSDTLHPSWLVGVDAHLAPDGADHYELVGEELGGIVPLAGGALRILSGRLVTGHGEAFFDFARRAQAAQLDSGHILVSHIGRRVVDAGAEAVYVTVWADAEALTAAGGSPSTPANRAQWEPYFADWSFGGFEAVATVAPRLGKGMVLLLADDDRRIVFATPAAGQILGRSAARLLGRLIEDLAGPSVKGDVEAMWASFLRDGRQSGRFELALADGTVRAMQYEARANVPWPGVHVSVLAEPGATIDFDDALATAGIIARYEALDPA